MGQELVRALASRDVDNVLEVKALRSSRRCRVRRCMPSCAAILSIPLPPTASWRSTNASTCWPMSSGKRRIRLLT